MQASGRNRNGGEGTCYYAARLGGAAPADVGASVGRRCRKGVVCGVTGYYGMGPGSGRAASMITAMVVFGAEGACVGVCGRRREEVWVAGGRGGVEGGDTEGDVRQTCAWATRQTTRNKEGVTNKHNDEDEVWGSPWAIGGGRNLKYATKNTTDGRKWQKVRTSWYIM